MAEATNKKRKAPQDAAVDAKKKKVAISEAPPSLPHTISVSSVVRPKFSPPVLGMISVASWMQTGINADLSY
jgi:hypothetical protein